MFIGFIFGVGVCEELTKIVPLLIFAGRKAHTAKSMIFMGIISGFGFAIAENINYAKRFGLQMKAFSGLNTEMTIIKYAELLSIQLLRFISLPLLHAAWSGIFAWFIWNYFTKKNFSYVWVGLFFTAILHGLYNSFCMTSTYLSFGFGLLSVYLLFAFLSLDSSDDILELKLKSYSK
jgi:RsiW-degrading membrane proteinase PrsW (M82 family)